MAVLSLCPREKQADVRRALLRFAANHAGSSVVGTVQEGTNITGLAQMLSKAQWRVEVLSAVSREAFERGHVRGAWCLGAPDGVSLGVVMGFESEGRVSILKGAGVHLALERASLGASDGVPPW